MSAEPAASRRGAGVVRRPLPLAALALIAAAAVGAIDAPPASRPIDAAARRAVMAKMIELRLAPDLSALAPAEREGLALLLRAGDVMQNLYELQNHRQAPAVRRRLATRELRDLYRENQGPIVTTLDNERLPLLPGVDSLVPGRNVYPWGVGKEEIDRWLAVHPEDRAEILDPLTAVRRATPEALREDLAALARHPALRVLHPALESRLRERLRRPARDAFYAVPYALAYADSLERVSALLHRAADVLQPGDAEFAGYLRLRARDLLANDYEGGDAAWVTGRFGRLNLQIGAYETYDDELFGVKAFHSASVLLNDVRRSEALRAAIRDLQQLENSLPYEPHKRVREDISIGIYDVVADYGQARGTNTASILPNDARIVRRYGRTILMRRNILLHPVLVGLVRDRWGAAIDPAHRDDFDPEAGMQRVLWHEIGHYLGPDRDASGRSLDLALQEEAGTFEEMKADLVALFVANSLRRSGYYDERTLRGVYAAGVGRLLQENRPRRDQAYGTMELMQLNWYLDRGLLAFDPATKKLRIRYERYPEAVASMLREVLAIQHAGDRKAADRFIERWAVWDDRHEALASAMRAAGKSRFRLVRYAALGE